MNYSNVPTAHDHGSSLIHYNLINYSLIHYNLIHYNLIQYNILSNDSITLINIYTFDSYFQNCTLNNIVIYPVHSSKNL